MNGYRDLEIYTDSKSLVIEIHKITMGLPKFELFEEGSQVRRSSKSITAMIVEGYGRKRYKADYIKYLVFSHAECDETILHLDFLFETDSFKDENLYQDMKLRYETLSRKIYKYIKWLESQS